MKYIMIIFVLLMVISTQAVAGETTMVCDARGDESRYYEYISPFFGRPSVQQKIDDR